MYGTIQYNDPDARMTECRANMTTQRAVKSTKENVKRHASGITQGMTRFFKGSTKALPKVSVIAVGVGGQSVGRAQIP